MFMLYAKNAREVKQVVFYEQCCNNSTLYDLPVLFTGKHVFRPTGIGKPATKTQTGFNIPNLYNE